MENLPQPDELSLAHSQQVANLIAQEIKNDDGKIPFSHFMSQALYAPGLGYYSAGNIKFGASGDFVTAPEISPLFSYCVAAQCGQILNVLEEGNILELGAGSGAMAADILSALEKQNALPTQYLILEVSADLRQRQQKTLEENCPHLLNRVTWLDTLPSAGFRGMIIANEVMDAMPVSRFHIGDESIEEYYVEQRQDAPFVWRLGEPSGEELLLAIQQRQENSLQNSKNYTSEINLQIRPWIRSLSDILQEGIILLIDYGFPEREYYHPQRDQGTLMCHYRHRAHSNPLILPGIQDITAHVDFTAVAEASVDAGLEVLGFATQAAFLLNCGITNYLQTTNSEQERVRLTQQVKKLTHPSEMGELFKVFACGRHSVDELLGFTSMDMRHRL